MEVYLKKYFWTLGVIVTVVCAMLAGKGVTHIVEAKYLLDGPDADRASPGPQTAPPASSQPKRDKSGQPLADRNIFCAACEPPQAEFEEPEIETDPDRVPMTSLPLELVATNVSTNRALSFATIRNRDSNRQGAYWLEQAIPDAGEIVRITGRYVDFVNESAKRVERISLLGDEPASRPMAQSPVREEPRRPERQRGGGDDVQAMLDDGIRQTGDNEYEIRRDLVDQVLANPAQVARGARIVPSIRDGEANGFKLYAIRPSSVFAKVGLMNGDTINEINGFDLTTPDRALEVYQRVRDANNLTVTVTRRGEPVTLRYTIR
jgi:general secretion pathway protein C